MREILFRGKRIDNGEWVYGYLCKMGSDYYIITSDSREEIDSKTIGQYTGLTDKNGVKIFEGDLLRIPFKSDFEKENYVQYEVFFHDNDMCEYNVGFQMNRHHFKGSVCGTSDFKKFIPKNTNRMIVIGNIHDK
jgi:uncharacterized phage protein (TIGR01671 family)